MGKKISTKALLGIIVGVLAVVAVITALILVNRNKLTAIIMRLIRQEGEVTLLDVSGKDISILNDMKLYSGNALLTGGDGLADLSLDDTKFITIEHTSKVEFQKEGRALELKLMEGRLFFNVTEKLADDETMDISTSTMVVGIRGTSGWVDADNSDLYVGDGTVHVTGINPNTGDTIETDATAGQKIHVYLVEKDGKTVAFEISAYRVQDIPREMLRNIVTTPELFKRILEETDFSAKEIIREAIIKKILPGDMVLDEDMQKVLEEVLKEMEEQPAEEPEEEEKTTTAETTTQTRRPTTAASTVQLEETTTTPVAAPAASTATPAAASNDSSNTTTQEEQQQEQQQQEQQEEEEEEEEPVTYTITVGTATGGTASASATAAEAGTKITLTAEAERGYQLSGWSASSGVTVANNEFEMPEGDVTVTPLFEALPLRTLTVKWGIDSSDYDSYNPEARGGSVSTSPAGTAATDLGNTGAGYYASSTVSAYDEDEITLTATPLAGYKFVEWIVEGGAIVADTGNATTTVTMQGSDATVQTVFTSITYTYQVVIEGDDEFKNGISFAASGSVEEGRTYYLSYGLSVDFFPPDGLEFDVDGCSASDGGTINVHNGSYVTYTPSGTMEDGIVITLKQG